MGRKAEVETSATYQEESADLVCKCAGHAKEYHCQLRQSESGWTVTAQSGKIGSALVDQPNKVTGVDYLRAKKVFNQVVKEKLAKNPPYKLVQGEAPAQPSGGRIVNREVVFSPELLTRVTEQEAIMYAKQDRYWFQQKRDDRRLVAVIRGEDIFGLNKNGQTIQVSAELRAALRAFQVKEKLTALMLDGEIEKDGFYVWDALTCSIGGTSVIDEAMPYRTRYRILGTFFIDAPSAVTNVIHVVESAKTLADKIAFLQRMKDENAEGIVIKDSAAPYRAGRCGQHFKLKFEQTGSVIVGKKEKNDGHRSVGIYAVNGGGKLHYLGSVGVPDKYDLPQEGQVIEVRGLYRHGIEGRMGQAKYFGKVRDDVRPSECSLEQFRVRQEVA